MASSAVTTVDPFAPRPAAPSWVALPPPPPPSPPPSPTASPPPAAARRRLGRWISGRRRAVRPPPPAGAYAQCPVDRDYVMAFQPVGDAAAQGGDGGGGGGGSGGGGGGRSGGGGDGGGGGGGGGATAASTSPWFHTARPRGEGHAFLAEAAGRGAGGGGPCTGPPALDHPARPDAAALRVVAVAEVAGNGGSRTRGDRPASPAGRPGARARGATAAAASAAAAAATPRGAAASPAGGLPAWAVIRRGRMLQGAEVDVQLVVPIRWTPAGRLVVRPPLGDGSRLDEEVEGEEEVVPPERIVVMGPPRGGPDGHAVAAPRRASGPEYRHGGVSDQGQSGDSPCRCRTAAAPLHRPGPRLLAQHSEPLIAASATRAWLAATHDTGCTPAAAGGGGRPAAPPAARGLPRRGARGEPAGWRDDGEDPTLEMHTAGLFPTLPPPAADIPLVRVNTDPPPTPVPVGDTRRGVDDWQAPYWPPPRLPPPVLPNRCVVSFSSPLPAAGSPPAVAFSFLGVLVPSISSAEGVVALRLEWATLRFAAAPVDGGVIGDRRGDRGGGAAAAAAAAAAVVDMVDFGVRLPAAAAAAAGWVVDAVEPRPGCDVALLTSGAPDVSVAAGPSGVSVSRAGGASVETARPPYAVAATVGAHCCAAHDADWRWELTGLDDGSPYYAHRGGRRAGGGGGWRTAVAAAGATATPAAATQSHAAPAGALHASWTAPAAAVAATPALTFEVYARPRVVRWPRGGLGASFRLALSRSEPRIVGGSEYKKAFSIPLPIG